MMDEDDGSDLIEDEVVTNNDTGKTGVVSLTLNSRSRPDKSNESGSAGYEENDNSCLIKRQKTAGVSENNDDSNNDRNPSEIRTSFINPIFVCLCTIFLGTSLD
jgi:hypothetical protein